VYLNELDPYAAQWLRHLWPEARVDARSILDVRGADIVDRRAHFFAGIGGWEYALQLAGWPATCVVCGQTFIAKWKRRTAKCCSAECVSAWGRICAGRRWHGVA